MPKKLSAYNRHVRSFAKTYRGNPKNMMKAAAKAWRAKSSSSRSRAPTKKKGPRKNSPSKRRKKTVPKKKTRKRSSFKLPGGVGPKGIIMGALGMMLVPRLLPVPPSAAKLATGLSMRALNIGGGGALSAVGLMELAASFAAPLLGGVSPIFGGAGVNGSVPSGVFDY